METKTLKEGAPSIVQVSRNLFYMAALIALFAGINVLVLHDPGQRLLLGLFGVIALVSGYIALCSYHFYSAGLEKDLPGTLAKLTAKDDGKKFLVKAAIEEHRIWLLEDVATGDERWYERLSMNGGGNEIVQGETYILSKGDGEKDHVLIQLVTNRKTQAA